EALGPQEAFCGVCGTRVSVGGDIQSKWASMWHLKEAAERKRAAAAGSTGTIEIDNAQVEDSSVGDDDPTVALTLAPIDPESSDAGFPTNSASDTAWTSASNARK